MVTLPQYPQHLYVQSHSEAQQDDTGAWRQTPGVWSYVGACREETNGKGNTVATADGQVLVFASLVQLPVGTPRVDEGKTVLVLRGQAAPDTLTDAFIAEGLHSGEVVIKGVCKKFNMGRLHCRLWI